MDNNELADTVTVQVSNQGINCDVSVSDQMDMKNSLFYPNPAESVIYLNPSFDKNSVVEVFDISGRQLRSFDLNRGYTLSLDELHSGIFLLRITLPDEKILYGKIKKK
jgi:hypothetical protein